MQLVQMEAASDEPWAAECPREEKDTKAPLIFILIIDETTVFGYVMLNKTCR